ncbi:MAG: hypothetical protein LBB53_01155 [Prevotellaceae bacterium]|jgi:hypothetical protein|nr:hypothetical protein [Prevotellaceae bacterium]
MKKEQIFHLPTVSILIFTLAMAMSGNAHAQVTIGADQEPMNGSLLELISTDSALPKGLRLPLLSSEEVEIFASQINTLPPEEKTKMVGMLIFNTSINCSMVWNGKEFKSLCGDVGPAEITPICDNVRIYPNSGYPDYTPINYQQGKIIDGTESYMVLPVIVSKAGTYDIIARTGNGYSFSQQGTLLEVGDHILRLPASGTPIEGDDNPQYYDHIISFEINGDDASTICTPANLPSIPVAPAVGKAVFTIDCAQSNVNGTYIVDQAVGNTHNIKVRVNVTAGGYYNFEAEAAGVHFSRSGVWLPMDIGNKEVTLFATGKPVTAGVIPVQITGETTSGTVVCNKTFNVAYRAIKILCFGIDNYSGVDNSYSMNRILKSSVNFGVTGTVPTQSITVINGGTGNSNVSNRITTNNPDIIIIGYNFHPNSATNSALVDFINNKKGFVLMMAQDDGNSDAATLSAIMGSSVTVGTPQSGGIVGGNTRPFITDNDNPLINGPFLNIGGKYWGDDAGTTYCVRSTLPAGFEDLSSNNTIVWKKNGNFVYIGDGGFGIGNSSNTSSTVYPCAIDADGRPKVKTQFSNGGAYNSYFFANVMVYAIKWAQNNR